MAENRTSLMTLVMAAASSGFAFAEAGKIYMHFFEKPERDLIVMALVIGTSVILLRRFGFTFRIPPVILVGLPISVMFLVGKLTFYSLQWTEYSNLVIYLCVGAVALGFVSVEKEDLSVKLIVTIVFTLLGSVLERNLLFPALIMALLGVAGMISLLWNKSKPGESIGLLIISMTGLFIGYFFPQIRWYSSQSRYHDPVIESFSTRFQDVDVTQWKGDRWVYLNGKVQFTTLDWPLYYEPFAHPALLNRKKAEDVLVIGGENRILPAEILKHRKVKRLSVLPIDNELLKASGSQILLKPNNFTEIDTSRTELLSGDPLFWLETENRLFDVVFLDLPDPVDIETNQYFTAEFFRLISSHLKKDGWLVMQSLSPYLTPEAHYIIQNTLEFSGFQFQVLHNQVPTLGEWSWIIAILQPKGETEIEGNTSSYDQSLISATDINGISTRWLNREAFGILLHAGKPTGSSDGINTMENPILHQYYLSPTSN